MRLLLVFLKEPIPGKVKPRLAAELGEEKATLCYQSLVSVLLKQLQGLENTRIRFCYTPDDASDAVRFWILPTINATSTQDPNLFLCPKTPLEKEFTQEVDFRPQGEGTQSERMLRAFTEGFNDGFEHIVAIDADCPYCGSRWINAAIARFAHSPDIHGAIGPSPRGGCYLLGLQTHAPSLFGDFSWDDSNACKKIMQATSQSNIHLMTLPPLNKINTINDWNELLESPLGPAIKKELPDDY